MGLIATEASGNCCNDSEDETPSGDGRETSQNQDEVELPPPPEMWLNYNVGYYIYGEVVNGMTVDIDGRAIGTVKVPLTKEQNQILADLWNNNFPQQFTEEVNEIKRQKYGTEDVVGKEREKSENVEKSVEGELSKEPKLKGTLKDGTGGKEKEAIKVESGKAEKEKTFVDKATANGNAITALQKTGVDYQSKPSDPYQLGVREI